MKVYLVYYNNDEDYEILEAAFTTVEEAERYILSKGVIKNKDIAEVYYLRETSGFMFIEPIEVLDKFTEDNDDTITQSYYMRL